MAIRPLRVFIGIAICAIMAYVLLPSIMSPHRQERLLPVVGDDMLKHFMGSHVCKVRHADIYLAPWPTGPQVSPFCKDRASLLKALSTGTRHRLNGPYVGRGCTYRWFPTTEICMILERFSAIVFAGDEIAQSVYAAFNILLREDLSLGGLRGWAMGHQDHLDCKCDNQFLKECLRFAITSFDDMRQNDAGDRKETLKFCDRIPHGYIPAEGTPASASAQALFREFTYSKPKPWRPSPLVFSLSNSSQLDVAATTRALDEWATLAMGAERNIPMLFLGPRAAEDSRLIGVTQGYESGLAEIAGERKFDVLNLYNATLQASTIDGERYGQRVALVEAMMVINWLSKLETS